MSDPWKEYRKAMCFRIADDLRAAALQADEWGHELREKALAQWAERNPYTTQAVAEWIENVGMRRP
ncbi:hypothetical protein [Noviluteimonas gilva]|uniref:Uncharacterized protein n=1 Tax=Noviluteimonas gilva TaxID=2682097 RepID=A0A7C9HRC2_9GAMM|nr:hypothetical protein [Lysobacter gilvus]MUV13551.1 hypothetical protein [Lysobacter gilvus]